MSVEIHVVGHHKRLEQAIQLASKVDATDVWIDNGSLGEWKNHYRAWTTGSYSESSHVCVLQDDAVPIDMFTTHLQTIVELRPNDMLGLYVGNGRPHPNEVLEAVSEAETTQAGWLSADAMCWGVGIVVPTHLIPEMLESVKELHKTPYDQRLSAWLHYTDRTAYYPWPSLVDHEDGPSLAWRGVQGVRKAHKIGIPYKSSKVVEINRLPKWIVKSKKD